jgi:DNA polymerase-3 subunit delta
VAGSLPVVYLLEGDDEFGIDQFLNRMSTKVGDEAVREANIDHLDGRNIYLSDIKARTSAMPFIAQRRLVILEHPLSRIEKDERKAIQDFLASVPSSTALVLVERRFLSSPRDFRNGKLHWLEKWAQEHKDSVYFKRFELPGHGMPGWIQNYARERGGIFSPPAAVKLYQLTGDDTRQAAEEIEKLLAYVDYSKPVEEDHVLKLTPETIEADIFKMVDALGEKDSGTASMVLKRLLEQQDHSRIFSMVVRQFRLLILVRDLIDRNYTQKTMGQELGFLMRPWMVKRIMPQASRFTLQELKDIYIRLLELDVDVKSSRNTIETGLFVLIAGLTGDFNRRQHYRSRSH